MRCTLLSLAMVIMVSPCYGQLVSFSGGVAIPSGSFADPPSGEPTERGAKVGYWGGAAYLYQMGPAYLRGGAMFLSCAEKLKVYTMTGAVARFRHQFFAVTAGIEKQFYDRRAIRPLLFLSTGVYIYKTGYGEENTQAEDPDVQINEYNFQMRLRPGLQGGGGVVFEVVEELVQLRLEIGYTVVFTGEFGGLIGLEGGGLKEDYPYKYTEERLEFWTIAFGFVFQPQ